MPSFAGPLLVALVESVAGLLWDAADVAAGWLTPVGALSAGVADTAVQAVARMAAGPIPTTWILLMSSPSCGVCW
ncbi:MAG: hypothetical protein M0Z51_13120 [Propionibacterium sp.]|nr:hypothetical protein [Propionibacterium sp.]